MVVTLGANGDWQDLDFTPHVQVEGVSTTQDPQPLMRAEDQPRDVRLRLLTLDGVEVEV